MFVLNHKNQVPLYTQLYNQIKEQILSGTLASGSKLPSVRELAVELCTSRNTVESSYQELYAEGYLYSRPRSGYFVSALHQDALPLSQLHKPRLRDPLPELPTPCMYDFHPARLDRESFPASLWRKCFLDSLRDNSPELSQYGDPQGEWGLRCNIQKYLERSRGVLCAPEQIVICSGLQHSIDIVAHMLKEKHRVAAVENPGYFLPRSVLRNHAFKVIPVPVGSCGLDLDMLKNSGSSIAYVTPSHQFPLGYVMPVANRLALIEWAESGGNLILEDDYDSELRYQGKPIPSLQGLRPGGNVIYLGTFSKILSPALRMSYLVLPRWLLSTYRRLFHDYFCSVSLLEQRTLAEFMEQGHWERHVRRMRTLYKKKHDSLLRAVERHFGRRAVIVGQGAGLHVVLQLTEKHQLDERELISRAQSSGIRLFPFSVTYAGDEPDSSRFLLGFGAMTSPEIEQGIELLFKLWYP
ncbi:MAG: GntR family transcriptional regulator [Geobacteraceae bacterium GWC2_58_44]|nr:MAG: GntR family transcriptional regulator [Geobacteraceae bacterium GWC2_58_44]HBG04923.1 PLP-dependent aminotransferase family protein [Geobacter sp.]